MVNPKSKAKMNFKKSWAWPWAVELFIAKHIEGKSLHVCCGSSNLGDVKIDKYVTRPGVRGGGYV